MMQKPTIHILLSTYNGERFLEAQLNSLLKQTYSNYIIHTRDDGSTDNTLEILESWMTIYPDKFTVTQGENIGVISSFLELTRNITWAPGDVFAFCDQDDIWLPDKLEQAVTAIKQSSDPSLTLYCSRLEYVDQQLSHLGFSDIPGRQDFGIATVENIATGCTVAFGENIREYLLQGNPEHMMMHDWWAYLIASGMGHVVYDERVTIQYRQHPTTVTPWEPGLKRLFIRARNFYLRMVSKSLSGLDSLKQAKHFIDTYDDLPDKNRRLVEELLELRRPHISLKKRLAYLMNSRVKRTDPLENISLKLLIVLRLH